MPNILGSSQERRRYYKLVKKIISTFTFLWGNRALERATPFPQGIARKNKVKVMKNLHKSDEAWERYRKKAELRAFLNRTDAAINHGITQKEKVA